MKKGKIKKILIIFVIIALCAGGAYFVYIKYFSNKDGGVDSVEFQPNYGLDFPVQENSFESSIDLLGTTKIKNEQRLSFTTAGKVTSISYQVGDQVKKGDILATIDSREAQSEVEKAKIAFESSKQKLADFINTLNTTGKKKIELDVESMKTQIAQKKQEIQFMKAKQVLELENQQNTMKEAEKNLQILRKEINKNITNLGLLGDDKNKILKDKNIELDKLTREYDELKKNFDNKVTQKVNDYNATLQTQYVAIETTVRNMEKELNEADKYVGLNGQNTFEYSIYFSAKDFSNIQKVKRYLGEAREAYENMKDAFREIESPTYASGIIHTLEVSQNFYDAFYNASKALADGFDNSVETEGFSQSDINALSSLYTGKAADMSSKSIAITKTIDELKNMESLEKIKKDLTDELETKKNAIDNLELNIKKTAEDEGFKVETSDSQAELEKLKLKKTENNFLGQKLEFEKFLVNQKDELRQTEIALERLLLDEKELEEKREEIFDLEKNQEYIGLKNSVKQSEISLEDVINKLGNYRIEAPFDGIITKIEMNIGDRLTSDNQKYIALVDPNSIEIQIFINQSDIVKLKKGMDTRITLDAYSDTTFTGSISELDTTPKELDGISKFEGKIIFANPQKLKLYTGMKAKVMIPIERITEGITVPITAVMSDSDGKQYVTVLKGDKKEKRYVEVGKTNGEVYQIINGLESGEKVLEIDYNSKEFERKDDQFGMGAEY